MPTNISAWVQKSEYFMDRFGASGPVSLAWELVPFSFVIDWFVDLSSVIGFYDDLLTGWHKTVIDASISTTYSHRANYRWSPGYRWNTPIDGTFVAQTHTEYYNREPFTPVHRPSLNVRFGKNQIAIASALIYEIVANLKAIRIRF